MSYGDEDLHATCVRITAVAIGHAGIEFIGSSVDMAVRLTFIPGHGSIGVATSYNQTVLSVRY